MLSQSDLSEAVRLTFEEMAFLDVADGPAPQSAPPVAEGPVLYLEYSRPKSGALALFLPKEIKFQVAEAIYGTEWATLTACQLDDSLLELLNILAGRILTRRFGDGTAYTMGLPMVLYDPPEESPELVVSHFVFHIDSWEFSLNWYEVAA